MGRGMIAFGGTFFPLLSSYINKTKKRMNGHDEGQTLSGGSVDGRRDRCHMAVMRCAVQRRKQLFFAFTVNVKNATVYDSGENFRTIVIYKQIIR